MQQHQLRVESLFISSLPYSYETLVKLLGDNYFYPSIFATQANMHCAKDKIKNFTAKESLGKSLKSLLDIPYNFVAPWYDFASDPLNQMIVRHWTIAKFSKFKNHIVHFAPLIFAFPISVIATNRILNTAISRGGTANSFRIRDIMTDLVALKRIGGHRTLYAGLAPTLFFYIITRGSDGPLLENTNKRGDIIGRFSMGFEEGTPTPSLSRLNDIEVFERSDAYRTDKDLIIWGPRHFPAIFRMLTTN